MGRPVGWPAGRPAGHLFSTYPSLSHRYAALHGRCTGAARTLALLADSSARSLLSTRPAKFHYCIKTAFYRPTGKKRKRHNKRSHAPPLYHRSTLGRHAATTACTGPQPPSTPRPHRSSARTRSQGLICLKLEKSAKLENESQGTTSVNDCKRL